MLKNHLINTERPPLPAMLFLSEYVEVLSGQVPICMPMRDDPIIQYLKKKKNPLPAIGSKNIPRSVCVVEV